MGPSRKKARTKPPNVNESSQQQQSPPSEHLGNDEASTEDPTSTKDTKSVIKELKAQSSWYGTWPRKSLASTQVARETILADKPLNGSTSDLSRHFDVKKTPTPTPSVLDQARIGTELGDGANDSRATDGGNKPAKDGSVVAEQTRETAKVVDGSRDGRATLNSKREAGNIQVAVEVKDAPADAMDGVERAKDSSNQRKENDARQPVTPSGWFTWLAVPGAVPSGHLDSKTKAIEGTEVSHKSLEGPKSEKVVGQSTVRSIPQQSTSKEETTERGKEPAAAVPATSWLGRWSTMPQSTVTSKREESASHRSEDPAADTVMTDASSANRSNEPAPAPSWVFWSTDTSKNSTRRDGQETGQIAVTGEPSQNQPEPAKASSNAEQPSKERKGKSAKRGRPLSTEQAPAQSNLLDRSPTRPASSSPAPLKTSPPNLMFPSVRSTYGLVENPSIIQQIARLLRISHQSPVKHVFMSKEKPKIKKALAIGIHGLFPATIVRTVIGQPTGTSIKFANYAASAIRRWTDSHGSAGCEIEKAALEGEGKIGERVDNLWRLLLNWIDHVRNADFILVACHSQGVPVAMMLVAKLIEFGVVTNARIGVCAMAGVSLGPFADYKSRFFGGSAAELFDFANAESVVSRRYADALRVALKYGVRVTYCGSIDDQVISMESSIFSSASHPYIYRAVFVDGRIHAPDFIAHLVGFALKLRNLGVSDHGLIRELSAPLAGSLYSGEGHSRLYDDDKVYDLSVEFALETSSVVDVPLEITTYEVPTNSNPYVLPWIMRGLLEEDFVKTELHTEVTELLKQFDDWKPATKVLKDVKYRLEAVRSKL